MKRTLKLSAFERDVGMHVHALSTIEYQGRKWKIVFMSEDRDIIRLED